MGSEAWPGGRSGPRRDQAWKGGLGRPGRLFRSVGRDGRVAEPDRYILAPVAQNAKMRAYRFELAPGEQFNHTHARPYLLVAVTAAQLSRSSDAGQSQARTFMAGDFEWIGTPLAHSIVNRGKDKSILVEIELK